MSTIDETNEEDVNSNGGNEINDNLQVQTSRDLVLTKKSPDLNASVTVDTVTSFETIRSLVRSPSFTSVYGSERVCCLNWLKFNPFRRSRNTIEDTSPLLPVHSLPYNSPIITSNQLSSIIFNFLDKWIISMSRRNYPNTIIWLFSTLITISLIAIILGLYFSGNLGALTQLAKALLCQIISQFNNDNSLPSFC
ncbi:unnamed protein product [Candida verbasci]|uniref:Uncharacterized protein n=1 Tax=Candida verbasci TaxID=1227364 RepID=A0A9W4TX32_9ASCO|nr:unnamed protein product [Candida verbasci]